MRKRYSASFHVGVQGGPVPSIEAVAEECLRWVLEGRRRAAPADWGLAPGGSADFVKLGDSASVSMLRLADSGQDLWGLRFDQVDATHDDLLWRTEICLSQDGDSGELAFSCDNMAGSVSQSIMPVERTASRPRIVPRVISKWRGYKGGYSLNVEPHALKTEEVDGFVDALLSPTRLRPVVFVSASNDSDRPVVDVDKLANWMAGLAHVVVAANRFPALRMDERLPERFLCYNGAVRIYWPGLNFTDPYRHKLWVPDRIFEIERRHEHGFRQFLLGYLSDIATAVSDPEAPSWALLEFIRRRQQIAEAIEKGQDAELLGLFQEDNAELRRENDNLKAQNSDLLEQVHREQSKARSWYSAYIEACKAGGGAGAERDQREPPELVADAINYAEADFADRIVFALNSKSDGRDSIFEHADDVYAAFNFLAGTYFRAKTGEEPCADLDQAARTEVGWRFEANQSKTAIGKYPEWYQCSHDGKVFTLEEHLKVGSSKDPRRTMRIAFAWDDDAQVVVIGFLGQHQRSDAT